MDYGASTSYGQTASNAAAVTSHAITLTSLLPDTKYYYRVSSGSLTYPQPAGASGVFFTTRTFVAPDLDNDGDVDHDDFGYLQRCFTGLSVAQNNAACLAARLDADTDVDSDDFIYFDACRSGASVPADPNCEP